jgi:thiol:disulfide interchange protein DsbD
MKRLFRLSLLSIVLLPGYLWAQQNADSVINWTFQATRLTDTSSTLSIKARIHPGWKLFSTTMPDTLPLSRIQLDAKQSEIRINSIDEKGQLHKQREPSFENAEFKYFEGELEWQVKVSGKITTPVRGFIQYMAIGFSSSGKEDSVIGPDSLSFAFGPGKEGRLSVRIGEQEASAAQASSLKRSTIDLKNPVNTCGGTGIDANSSKGLWNIFFLGFLGGLIALLTPCVFPMIPLTVSFFTKHAANKKRGTWNAVLYGFFIFFIYTLLSTPFYFLDSLNPEILNNISTNVYLNIFFFVVFIAFALSFFGLFEITLPGSFASSVDSRAGTGSLIGIFFMALTLALVSFSCTGPILGSLLAGSLSSQGGAFQLSCGMAGFGLALALPFALFALFPGWLHSLPKSGGWLNSVKIVLGFLELALAVKFLSNADLVAHWGILKREVFLLIWIITGIMLVLYLAGLIRFRHDSPGEKIGPLRWSAAILFLLFTLYLVPGIFKSKLANRTLISGFPPPLSYSIYGDQLVRLSGLEAQFRNDYEHARAKAQKENKPVLIDFTGWACVNCRKMEENVWTNPSVKSIIENDFILVSLYVDDRKPLSDNEQFVYTTQEGYKKNIRTIGDKFATFQSENFINASQPLYVILSPDEKLMNLPIGYTPDAGEYQSWLRCGLDAFRKAMQVKAK